MKDIIIIFLIVVLVGVGFYLLTQDSSEDVVVPDDQDEGIEDVGTSSVPTATTTEPGDDSGKIKEGRTVIGESVEGRDIEAYVYGDGDTHLLFAAGLHGGYDWNTVLLAYQMIDYLEENSELVPDDVRVSIIPVLNPDGLNKVVGTTGRFSEDDVASSQDKVVEGRFNGNGVDINRNFDCDWRSSGVWKDIEVDAGDEVFSEPESKVFRDYVNSFSPDGVVVWYSAAGGVFASNCHNGVLKETSDLTSLYADASGYPVYEEFDFYEINGDAVNWLAKKNIPAISVLLSNHEDVEWDKNWKGVKALFEYYSN